MVTDGWLSPFQVYLGEDKIKITFIQINTHTQRMTQVTLLTVMGMELYEFTTLWILMGIGIYLPYRLIHRGLTDSNTNDTTDK